MKLAHFLWYWFAFSSTIWSSNHRPDASLETIADIQKNPTQFLFNWEVCHQIQDKMQYIEREESEKRGLIMEEINNQNRYFEIVYWRISVVPTISSVCDEVTDLKVSSNDELDQLFQELSRSISPDSLVAYRKKCTELEEEL